MDPYPSAMRPRALASGVRVALVAPAGPLDAARIEASCARCRHLGLEPVVMPSAGARSGYLAGRDQERLADLQAALDDPGIGAVWALRGGYGTLRILASLDLRRQERDPVPFIGFSDNTSVHVRHAEVGAMSFHGPHPGGDFPPEVEAWFRRVLFRAEPAGTLPLPDGALPPVALHPGVVEAPLFGGNLALLSAMCGTRHAPHPAGRILCLEDVAEPAYRIDRMLVQLEGSGVLDGVVGLALGRFTGLDGETPAAAAARLEATHDALREVAARRGLPAVADLPFGHVPGNLVLPLGARARLDADAATLTLTEAAVRAA